MVPRQVREDASAEAQPRRPPLGQGVGGDLHHHMAAPGPLHLGQEGLQGVGVRRGPPGGQNFMAHEILVRPDEADLGPQGLLQDRFQ